MKILLFIISIAVSIGCTQRKAKCFKGKVLFAVSNASFYGESDIHTANHFPEIVLAYDIFKKSGYQIDFMSPGGGKVPLGYIYSDSLIQHYLYDEELLNLLQFTYKPSQIDPSNYTAIFYPGGGSAMFGVPLDTAIQRIALRIYETGSGVVSTVCHGTAGIANIQLSNGDFLVADKRINGFPDLFEDKNGDYFQQFPFSIEEQITAHGGLFRYSSEGWDQYLEVDGRVITGQDPTSSALVAKAVIKALNKKSISTN